MTIALSTFVFILFFAATTSAQSGAIVAVGGGGTTDAIVARTLELAGGKNAIVAVLPQSSAVENAGDSSVKMWLDAGAKEARKIDFAAPGAKAARRRGDARGSLRRARSHRSPSSAGSGRHPASR